MTIDQAARTIGCTRRTVFNMLADGRLVKAGLAPKRGRGNRRVLISDETVRWAAETHARLLAREHQHQRRTATEATL